MLLEESFPEARPLASVFLSYESEQDITKIAEATWLHIAQLLTSLSEAEIGRMGGFEVVEPVTGRQIYQSHKVAA